jgi:hypothetical protein
MMVIYPGDIRVFHLLRRSEVFVPASEEEATRFADAYVRELARRITPVIDILGEVFPRVAEAYRRADIAEPVTRIGIALDEYEDEPDAIVDEICLQTRPFDLKLNFRHRDELARFLQEYEAVMKSPGRLGGRSPRLR